jgi:excisionase family DNA binding protein
MSSNIEVQKICQFCGKEFTAKTTVTKYCGGSCSKRAYKMKLKTSKIERCNNEVKQAKLKPIEEIKAKDFLTVRDAAQLLNCSIRTTYRLIEIGNIKAVNLSQRKTIIKRSDIDKLFEQPQAITPQPEQPQIDILECYTISEVLGKYRISETALYNLIKRESVPKIKKGLYTYVPKSIIDKLLS